MTRAFAAALVAALACPLAATAQNPAAPAQAAQAKVAPAKKPPASAAAKIANAMQAAPASVSAQATILDWPSSPDGKPTTLRAGTNGWVCYPRMPGSRHNNPQCLDEAWQKWGEAFMAHKDPPPASFGVSYMLAPGGDEGSNTDPYATAPTPTNEWGKDGPHVMLLLPASAMEGLPTKRTAAGPYVMYAGTPYVHVMLPIGVPPK